jgi:hypothetical protein
MGVTCLNHCRYVFVVLCVVAWCGVESSDVFGSTQYWPSAGIAWDVNESWMFKFKETYFAYVEDSGSDHLKSDMSAIYKGTDSIFDVAFGFAYVDSSGQTNQEERPYLSTTLRSKILDRDVSNRFMVEYRDISGASDYWRFRDKVSFNSAFDGLDTREIRLLNRERFRPYIADEVFFSSNGQGLSQNRVYLGVKIKIVQNVGLDTYYLYQSVENSSDRWQNNHIIGMDITFSF